MKANKKAVKTRKTEMPMSDIKDFCKNNFCVANKKSCIEGKNMGFINSIHEAKIHSDNKTTMEIGKR